MISSMSFAALPWEFSIAWIADKESENITVSVGVELPLSNCFYKGVKGLNHIALWYKDDDNLILLSIKKTTFLYVIDK